MLEAIDVKHLLASTPKAYWMGVAQRLGGVVGRGLTKPAGKERKAELAAILERNGLGPATKGNPGPAMHAFIDALVASSLR